MTIRTAFAEQFGEDQAAAIEAAACQHENGVHGERGSDPFKWALAICIGYECMTSERYRPKHGITADPGRIRQWVYEHGDLASHDGDIDTIAALAGAYEGWFKTAADGAE